MTNWVACVIASVLLKVQTLTEAELCDGQGNCTSGLKETKGTETS